MNPVHVLGEVPDLVERVPHGKLEIALGRAGRESELDFDEVFCWRGERDGVGSGLRGRLNKQKEQSG